MVPSYLITDFDEEKRILHISFARKLHPGNEEHVHAIFQDFAGVMEGFTEDGPIYLIIDMTNFIIEPHLKAAYAINAQKICRKYIKPRGVARYGYQITRITVRSSYNQYLGEDPNIFNSREEAFAYIHSLIEKDRNKDTESSIVRTGDCADC